MPAMRRVLLVAGVLLLTLLASACSSSGGSGNVSRAQGVRELQQTRLSIDRTLDLIKNGQAEQAFAERVWGRLVPGASADLIWLNRDPRDTPALELPALRIRGTYVRGTLGHPVTP